MIVSFVCLHAGRPFILMVPVARVEGSGNLSAVGTHSSVIENAAQYFRAMEEV